MIPLALPLALHVVLGGIGQIGSDRIAFETHARHLQQPPAEAAAAIIAAVDRQGAYDHLDAIFLWDAARVLLDRGRDPGAAVPILRRIVRDFPDSRPAERARAALGRVEALGPSAAEVWALPAADEAAFIDAHADAPLTPLVAIRHSTTLPEAAALALLTGHRHDRRWGWAVDREIGRRLYEEGRFIDAWRAADAAGDAGRVRASLRMIAWRVAPFAGVCAIAGALWWIRRRRRRPAG